METHNIDEAFEWLVVVFGIVSAILIQYPEYFYMKTPNPDRPISLRAVSSIVPPVIIAITIWLIGKISSRSRIQALAKMIAWMFLLGITWIILNSYLLGIICAILQIPRYPDYVNLLNMLGYFLFNFIANYFVITPKYRNIYPDTSFLKSKAQFLIIYGAVYISLLLLIMSTI